ALARKGIALIPTCCVYRLLAEEPALFGVGPDFQAHAQRACEGQRKAVAHALREGVVIGYGTDFYSDPALAPYARHELDVLMEYGLSEEQALAAGTSVARRILGL
ncbi:MAG: amidohydrolase, partial [Clostridia bacterium]|nr:amidohydrolase [Clostridia bacterium]